MGSLKDFKVSCGISEIDTLFVYNETETCGGVFIELIGESVSLNREKLEQLRDYLIEITQ